MYEQVVHTEGIQALAIGLSPTLLRNCIWNSLFYGSMHEVGGSRWQLDTCQSVTNQFLVFFHFNYAFILLIQAYHAARFVGGDPYEATRQPCPRQCQVCKK